MVNIFVSSECEVNKGLRQGNGNSHLLFNVVLEIANRRSKVETRGTVYDECSPIMAYAYVIFIMGRGLLDVGEVFTKLAEKPNKIGLEINEKGQNLWQYHDSLTMNMNMYNLVHRILKY